MLSNGNKMKISLLPSSDRPREKALKNGIKSLTDSELLAIILWSGTKGASVLEISQTILSEFPSLKDLFSSDINDLKVKGISKVSLLRIKALIELSHRANVDSKLVTKNTFLEYLKSKVKDTEFVKEEVRLFIFSKKGTLIREKSLFIGGDNFVNISPSEIVREVFKEKGSSFAFSHVHVDGSKFF